MLEADGHLLDAPAARWKGQPGGFGQHLELWLILLCDEPWDRGSRVT